MLVQYKVDFVSVPNYTVTVQNMSFSFGVLCHINCQRMNKKHNIKLHVKKLGCGECTVNITHNYVQVKVWSDLPSERFIIHVANKWGLGCEGVRVDFNVSILLLSPLGNKKICLLQYYGYKPYSNNSVNCLRITK